MDLFTTVIVAFVLFLVAFAMIGIGWLITGKMKIKPGSCGRAPHQKKEKECGNQSRCFLCDEDDEPKQ